MYKKIKLENIVQIGFYFIILGIFCYGMKNLPIKPTLFLQIPGVFFVLLSLFSKKYKLTLNLSKILYILYILIMIISTLIYKSSESFLYIYYFTLAFFTCNVMRNLSKSSYFKILYFLLSLCMINSTITLISVFFPEVYIKIITFFHTPIYVDYILSFYNVGNYSGIFIQVGQNAFYSALGIILFLILAITPETKNNKNIFYLCILLLIVTLFLTSKRGILLYTFVVLTLIIFFEFAIKNKKKFFKIIGFLLLIVLFSAVFLKINSKSLNIINRFVNDDVLNGREKLYSSALSLFKEKPLLGHGIRSFRELNGFTTLDVHNNFLQSLAETGIIGFALFYAAFIISIISIKKNIKTCRKNMTSLLFPILSLSVQILIFLNSITENIFINIDTLFIYFIFCGFGYFSAVKEGDINAY